MVEGDVVEAVRVVVPFPPPRSPPRERACSQASRNQVNRSRNTDHAARTCERFVYSILIITMILHGRQFLRKSRGAKGMWAFFSSSWMCLSGDDWLGWTNSYHVDKTVLENTNTGEAKNQFQGIQR